MIRIERDTYWLDHLDECEWDDKRNGLVPRKDASDEVKKSFERYREQIKPYRELERRTGRIIV